VTCPPIAIARSGLRLDLLRPASDSIRLSDIAEHLAKLCRWCGAPERPWSVAQHSIEVAELMYRAEGPMAGLYGMLHDAHETYIGDITEPAKAALAHQVPAFAAALDRLRATIDDAIHAAFDLDWPMPRALASLLESTHDRVVCAELRDLMPRCDDHVEDRRRMGCLPLSKTLRPYPNYITAAENYTTTFRRYASLAGRATRLD
jgi:hypothetical protein